MFNKARVFFLSLTIVAMLAFSAVGTTTVFADDGITTGSSETNITSGGTEQDDTSTTSEEQPTETTTPEGADQGDTSTTGEEQPSEGATTEATDQEDVSTTSEEQPVDATTTDQAASPTEEQVPAEVTPPLLEQLPENTTVAVVDAAGEPQPLVSQTSAEAVLLSDPIWCPEGQAPTPGENGCTASYASFTELLDFLKANEGDVAYQQAGTIYVQQGAYLGGESSIDFNSYNFTNLNQHNLTIHGGWDTTDNSTDPTDTSSFEVPLIIGSSSNPWVGSLTLNNLIFSNVSGQTGLILYSQGDINLSSIEVTNSLNGASLNAGGNVTVKKSKFNNNGSGYTVDANGTDIAINADETGSGLSINGGGAVTLQEVEANNNQLFGANIDAIGNVDVSDSFFNGNISYSFPPTGSWGHFGYGIQVVTTGSILLNGVTANQNHLFGASLDGATVDISNSFFNENGSIFKEDPTGYGLNVTSSGNVTLQGIEANDNEVFGANIDAVGDVVVIGGFFNGNASFEYVSNVKVYHGYGLQIVTTGPISLSDITATGNHLFGAHLEGSSIAISNGTFSNNGTGSEFDILGGGLEIVNTGTVSLFDVEANNNQAFGANIQAIGDVTISDSFFNGNKVYSYACDGTKTTVGGGYGLLVVTTDGDIALNTVEANNNYLYGAKLDGNQVAVTTGFFNTNGSDAINKSVGSGLEIDATSKVSLDGIEANNNQKFGVDIWTSGDVSINGGSFSNTQSLSFQTEEFFGYGLNVVTTANITLNDVVANYNYLWGGNLDGVHVSIANSQFNFNVSPSSVFIDDTGLLVKSSGDVNLFEVEAKENRLIGATINAAGNVFISQSNFSGNQGITCSIAWCPPGSEIYHGYGLNVITPGLISLDLVTANDNYLFGVHLEGSDVTVTNSSFNNNGTGAGNTPEGRGLEVISSGKVTIDLTEALDNQLFGANIEAVGDVIITTSNFIGNFHIVGGSPNGYGLKVVTLGDITLNSDIVGDGIQANGNGSGAILNGNDIQVTDSQFNNNGSGNGLTITATGNVILTNVTATGNEGNGVEVTSGTCVQVTGGTFTGNAQYGISVSGAPLSLDGTQTFGGNGAGDVFQDTPGTCVVVLSASSTNNNTNSNTTNTTTTVSSGNESNTSISSNSDNSTTTVSDGKNKKNKKHHHGRRHGARRGRGHRR